MAKIAGAIFKYPEIGICVLSCRLCPRYQSKSASRCRGCKSEERMGAGCPLITCAAKKGGIEFCWDCTEADTCNVWAEHRESGRTRDTFKCYRTMEDDIAFVRRHGAREFEREQKKRERLLVSMLEEFNEGRSMSCYCVAATILPENCAGEQAEYRVCERSFSEMDPPFKPCEQCCVPPPTPPRSVRSIRPLRTRVPVACFG